MSEPRNIAPNVAEFLDAASKVAYEALDLLGVFPRMVRTEYDPSNPLGVD